MRLDASPGSLAALTADGTIRCFADVKYQPTPPLRSRKPSVAFDLAWNLANDFASVLAAHLLELEPQHTPVAPTTVAPAQLYAVELHRNHLRVCFDVFLSHCTSELRQQMDETPEWPIHAVWEHGRGVFRGEEAYDARVAAGLARIQTRDKGPRPYFRDENTTMFYRDGIRVEEPPEMDLLEMEELAKGGLKLRPRRD